MKRRHADKWSTDVLEQIAVGCNIAANAKTRSDWELFLNAIYDAAVSLPDNQRAILLLSQEHALSCADIGRALNLPHSTVMHNLAKAVEKIVSVLKKKSLLDIRARTSSKLSAIIYREGYNKEESNAPTRFGFYYEHEPPWFHSGENPLVDEDE